jgi:hypothetical protein
MFTNKVFQDSDDGLEASIDLIFLMLNGGDVLNGGKTLYQTLPNFCTIGVHTYFSGMVFTRELEEL